MASVNVPKSRIDVLEELAAGGRALELGDRDRELCAAAGGAWGGSARDRRFRGDGGAAAGEGGRGGGTGDDWGLCGRGRGGDVFAGLRAQ